MDVLDLTHMPPLQGDQKALDVLHEEIIKNMHGASTMAKVVEPATCALLWHHYLPLVERHVKLVLVMALPIAHAHHACHTLQASHSRTQSAVSTGIIPKAHDPAHPPQALVPSQGVHQDPVVQALSHDQHPMCRISCQIPSTFRG